MMTGETFATNEYVAACWYIAVIMDRENITIMILMENIIMPMRMEQAAGMLRIRSS